MSDKSVDLFEGRDIGSTSFAVPQGTELELGATSEVDGRQWIETTLPNGTTRYILAATVRSRTTMVEKIPRGEPQHEHQPRAVPGISNSQPSTSAPLNLKKTIQDFIITGFGLVTSVLTALLLALIETKFGVAFYSFTWWFVIPVGALLAGFAAASGYYLGGRLFHHRPTRLLIFNVISVAITTYFLINYLNYSFLQVNGKAASALVSFGQYMNVVLRHQSMEFRMRSAKLFETDELGAVGFATAGLQILGFAVGGLAVYGYLRSAPYCLTCGKYLKKQTSIKKYTDTAEQIQEVYSRLVSQLQNESTSDALQTLSEFGNNQHVKGMSLNIALTLYRCVSCSEEFVDASVNRWHGKDWKVIPELHIRSFVPGHRNEKSFKASS